MSEQTTQEMAPTTQEEAFCDLYVNGGLEFAGQHLKCYREVFQDTTPGRDASLARSLLLQPRIMGRIKEMMDAEQYQMETLAVKLQVAETLKAVMNEAARENYLDRFGMPLSPAPLRAVSVNAAKALMDLYPIKHVQQSKLQIEGCDGNVIFNVIVPQAPADHAPQEDR